mmetsp:Transcript_30103/g.65687  ORF Transcript_30103/g.65687 Transcript_30103/m.65687 type:complete len:383 (+) Transcript_30103:110-1258(+)
MTVKPAVAFSFSKKAEPKRVVESLKTKKEEHREIILGLEAGAVTVDGKVEAQRKLTIPCKNPLESQKRIAAKAKAATEQRTPSKPVGDGSELPAGLISNLSRLSADDAEATRELLKDAARQGSGDGVDGGLNLEVAPILVRAGSKRIREGVAPEATKDMFDKVPVESFGEAMLLGMGYDPSQHKTKPVWHDKPRDGKLGLGAKALLPHEKVPAKKKGEGQGATGSRGAPVAGAGAELGQATATAAPEGSSEPKRPRTEGASSGSADEVWPRRGLVVRVIGAAAELKDFFGVEAVVLEAEEASGICRIKARVGGKSRVLEGVRMADLETRVGRDCTKVRVVRGAHRGVVADLLRRDVPKNEALVRIEGVESTMPLDDVCQFMG